MLEKSSDEKNNSESYQKETHSNNKENSVCTTELNDATFKNNSETCSIGKKLGDLEEIKFHENPLVFNLTKTINRLFI